MDKREKELSELKSYTEEIDKDVTMILQCLQWDRQHLMQGKPLVKCKYDPGHRIPEQTKEKHEQECFLKKNGYVKQELLPEPLDPNANTLVKLSNKDINIIINIAATSDPLFKKVLKLCITWDWNYFSLTQGEGCQDPQPLTLGRLQASYTMDERRAIHNAVVSQAPPDQETYDLTLPSNEEKELRNEKEKKSRLEILSQQRDMKRRSVKYRVASKTSNYSHVLRGVIETQMEVYTKALSVASTSSQESRTNSIRIKQEYESHRERHEEDSRRLDRLPDRDIKIEPSCHRRHTETREERSRRRDEEGSRDRHHREHRESNRRCYKERREYDSDRRSYKDTGTVRSEPSERLNRTNEYYENSTSIKTRHTGNEYWRRERKRSRDRNSRERKDEGRYERKDKHRSNGSQSYKDKEREDKLRYLKESKYDNRH